MLGLETIKINTKLSSYNVFVGDHYLKELGSEIKKIWSKRKIAIITDKNVADHFLDEVTTSLANADFIVSSIIIDAGESSKEISTAEMIYQQLIESEFHRNDGIIALGGGVVGDLAGFVASTYQRGISFIQVPTSLLAMVDSSVGGKTALDLGNTKNMIGTFYQPEAVYIDLENLKTLSERYLVEGYAEALKMGAISNPNFWELIEIIHSPADIADQAERLVLKSVTFKGQIIELDEKDNDLRRVLNFGHTIGHAVELLSNGILNHGEAVAIGMAQITRLTTKYGLTDPETSEVLENRLAAVGLPTESDLINTPEFFDLLIHDKKKSNDYLTVIYLKMLTDVATLKIPNDQIESFFKGTYSF